MAEQDSGGLEEEFAGTVEFAVRAGLTPWFDPSEYVHEVKGTAFDLDDREVGSIAFRLASTTEALNKGLRLFDVFDADSAEMESVFSTLLNPDGDAREELDIENAWNNLLYLESLEVRPDCKRTPLCVQLIETSIAMFCPDGLVAAIEESFGLRVEDWRRLGFARIADSPFVFRNNLKMNPYEPYRTGLADEASYTCGGCGEEIVIPLDLSQGAVQQFVEDCPVCCRPHVIRIEIDEQGAIRVTAEPEQDFDV